MSAMRCLTAASGSPQSAYTSQCLAATVAAAPEAPPKYSGIPPGRSGLTSENALANR